MTRDRKIVILRKDTSPEAMVMRTGNTALRLLTRNFPIMHTGLLPNPAGRKWLNTLLTG
jgi:hypothetical protein